MSSKKKKKSSGSGIAKGLRRNIGWIITGGLVLVVVAVALFAALSGGSSDSPSTASARTPTPDPRIGGATPAVSVSVEADDDGQEVNPRFAPSTLEGPSEEVIAIDITNTGTVAHNLRVSGVDKQYDTADDFTSATAQPGKEVELLVKIGTPGSFPFRCDFHPQQVGTLIIN